MITDTNFKKVTDIPELSTVFIVEFVSNATISREQIIISTGVLPLDKEEYCKEYIERHIDTSINILRIDEYLN